MMFTASLCFLLTIAPAAAVERPNAYCGVYSLYAAILALGLTRLTGNPTTTELLNAYIKSTHDLENARFQVQFKETYTGPTRANGLISHEGVYDIVHSGSKWKVNCTAIARFIDTDGTSTTTRQKRESLLDKEYILVLDDEGRDARAIIANLDGLPAGTAIGRLDRFAALFGFMPGNGTGSTESHLADVLKDSQLSVTPETLLDKQGWRLDSVGRNGHVAISYSDALEVQRIHVVKKGNDLANGTRIADFPVGVAGAWHPEGKVIGFESTLDFKQRGDWDGKSYPIRATFSQIFRYSLAQVKLEYDMQIDNVDLTPVPDDAFKISADIKDGTYVQVDDRPNVEYEWRGGEVVKAVNQRTVERLRGSSYFSTFSITGYFLLFAILLLVALGLISWVRQRIA